MNHTTPNGIMSHSEFEREIEKNMHLLRLKDIEYKKNQHDKLVKVEKIRKRKYLIINLRHKLLIKLLGKDICFKIMQFDCNSYEMKKIVKEMSFLILKEVKEDSNKWGTDGNSNSIVRNLYNMGIMSKYLCNNLRCIINYLNMFKDTYKKFINIIHKKEKSKEDIKELKLMIMEFDIRLHNRTYNKPSILRASRSREVLCSLGKTKINFRKYSSVMRDKEYYNSLFGNLPIEEDSGIIEICEYCGVGGTSCDHYTYIEE